MFGFGKRSNRRDISPQELASMLAAGEAVVVDVREPEEFVAGHIPGAVNLPLSHFSARLLPDTGDRQIVLSCAGGVRSAKALGLCEGTGVDCHLAGGFGAWTRAGLSVEG